MADVWPRHAMENPPPRNTNKLYVSPGETETHEHIVSKRAHRPFHQNRGDITDKHARPSVSAPQGTVKCNCCGTLDAGACRLPRDVIATPSNSTQTHHPAKPHKCETQKHQGGAVEPLLERDVRRYVREHLLLAKVPRKRGQRRLVAQRIDGRFPSHDCLSKVERAGPRIRKR